MCPRIYYEFGPFRIDPDKQVLLRDDQPVAITHKVFETLLILVRHGGEVVPKDQLMQELWPDAIVEEANLTQNIFMLRKVLEETRGARQYIVTVPGRGYRFTSDVRTVVRGSEDLPSEIQTASEEIGHPEVEPVPAGRLEGRARWGSLVSIAALACLVGASVVVVLRRRDPVVVRGKDPVLVANFTNMTGDPVFDDTLRRGLIVQLEQSPYLTLIPEVRIHHTLELMGQPAGVQMTPALARGVCERAGGTAAVNGSIATIGSQYVVALTALDCQSGALLDEEQAQATRKEDVLSALSQIASKFRARIGESLATIRGHDTPLEEATTPSLEALKAYSEAWKVAYTEGSASALPSAKRAIEIDPKFAMAYAYLGRLYGDLGESSLARENIAQAYALRKRVSERERFFITVSYYRQVTGDLERARQACELWARAYPHDAPPHALMAGGISIEVGQYKIGVKEAHKTIALDPDLPFGYTNLAANDRALGQNESASNALEHATEHKIDTPEFLSERYNLAFLGGDRKGMDEIAAESQEEPGAEDSITNKQAYVLAYFGHLRGARRKTARAESLAQMAGETERSAQYEAAEGVREALFGNAREAKRRAMAAMKLSRDRDVEYAAAIALAIAHSPTASGLTHDLKQRFPEDTLVRFNYLPVLRALIALDDHHASNALKLLQPTAPFELGSPVDSVGFSGALYPAFVRGKVYLALHDGTSAVAEFEKILDHRGIVVSDPIGALAHLEAGRAYAIAGDNVKARACYQDFLTLWEKADPDIPVLRQAKGEYAKLQD